MKRYKWSVVLLILLLTSVQLAEAQNFHQLLVSRSFDEKAQTIQKFESGAILKEVLAAVEKTYNVNFLFASNLLGNKSITDTVIVDENRKLYPLLDDIFAGFNLDYKKLTNRTFGIVTKEDMATSEAVQEQISGTVTDSETGEPMAGVNITVRGTVAGAATNAEGYFELTVPSLQDTLVVSFIGYKTKVVPINGRTALNIQLTPRTVIAEELVVVGYGTKSKKKTTESISTISSESLNLSPTINVANSLAGKATGLFVIQKGGYPYSDTPQIFVRGISTLSKGDSAPLILVDGVKRSFFHLNPNNIKSVTVLKDAAATAIYGIEGANGVILVETKRGQKGPAQISVSLSAGIQKPVHHPEFIGSYRYAKAYNRAQLNDGVTPANVRFQEDDIRAFKTGNYPIIYPDMNWIDYLTKEVAFQTQNSISVSGGTEDIRYYLSGGYLFQDGIFEIFDTQFNNNPSYKKYNFRTNLDMDLTPSTTVHLTGYGRVGTNVRIGNIEDEWKNIYHGAPFAGAGLVKVPSAPDEYGLVLVSGNSKKDSYYIPGTGHDPLKPYYQEGVNIYTRSVISVDIGIEQELNFLLEGLEVQFKASYSTIYEKAKNGDGGEPEYQAYFKYDMVPSAGIEDSSLVFQQYYRSNPFLYTESYNKDRQWYMEARIHYNRDFGKHSVEGLVLYNQRKEYYPSGEFTGVPRAVVGIAGRINYSYDDRYLLQFNMAYNGSENFAKERRFGVFPSFSAGWIVTNEEFMDDIDFLDYLKFTVSYGIVGNDRGVGRFLYLPTTYFVNGVNTPDIPFGYRVGQVPTSREGRLGNPLVTWEIAKKQNYGIDLAFFNNRLDISFDYFYEHRSDILTTLNTVPAYVAVELPAVNIGEVKNWGYELEVDWQQHITSDLSYKIGANVSFARNEVVFMDEVHRQEPYLRQTGEAVGQRFGYIFDRYYMKSDFGTDGTLKDKFAQPLYQVMPGDLKYKDLNADGVVDGLDRRPIGYTEYPEYMYGVTIGVQYKNFSLTTLWQGTAHVSRMFGGAPHRNAFGLAGRGTYGTLKWQIDGAWTPEKGQSATYPRLTAARASRRRADMDSNYWMHDASYVRLKNARLAYQLPVELVSNMGLKNLTIYVNGYNLLTFSELGRKYNIDPEMATTSNGIAYPIMRVYNFGVNIDF